MIIFISKKVRTFLETFFGTSDIKEVVENSEKSAQETHKSISSMETIYKDKIKRDFPDLNLNELKSMAEANLLNSLDTIESKNIDNLKNKNEKVVSFVENKISDLGDKSVVIDNIKIHKTVLNKYDVNDTIATIELSSSLEYFYKLGSSTGKKVQTRYKTQFIYVIDSVKLGDVKVLGINCPNCGAPIKKLGHKHCEYCNTAIIDLVKKVWILNNMKEY